MFSLLVLATILLFGRVALPGGCALLSLHPFQPYLNRFCAFACPFRLAPHLSLIRVSATNPSPVHLSAPPSLPFLSSMLVGLLFVSFFVVWVLLLRFFVVLRAFSFTASLSGFLFLEQWQWMVMIWRF